MPLKHFRFKAYIGDEERIVLVPVADALEGKFPDGVKSRFPKSFLEMASEDRPWSGKPHVTDLIAGPRYVWLKHTTDYSIDPNEAVYRVLGIQAHKKLEGIGETSEVDLVGDDVVGRSDLIEPNGDGTYTITDYKVVGSYKVAKALGIYSESVPVLDDSGKPVMFKTGQRAGLPKTKKQVMVDPKKADRKDWIRQLNVYRYLAMKSLGIIISNIQIFAIVRDGGTVAAISRGVTEPTYLFALPIFTEETVETFIKERSAAITDAMNGGVTPRVCDASESWEGNKCKRYCEVSARCRELGCHWLESGGPDEEDDSTD